MNKQDFLKLSGAAIERTEYLPVAFMIRGGYGCAGYYNAGLNEGLTDTCVLLNMRLVEFPPSPTGQSSIHNFSEFLERIVARHYREVRRQDEAGDPGVPLDADNTIPLGAVVYSDIFLLYPVAHITALMQRAEDSFIDPVPTFLDFRNKSIVFKVLTKGLW